MKEILGTKLYGVPDLASLFDLTPDTIRKYIREGKIQTQKIGGRHFSTEAQIKAYVMGTTATK